ncbi:hypothetical protein BT96DRAFT_947625 [Gymnopus androsaceus JB14]|uniref:Uncharacterized protein n=1 Tax=Gymnopus androsaceus JB14 TaxID=1447944 RepID=A0A6A4GTB9_9AGAR|nr:hypothetical protein BT96DRAFT_947625 [Gymnopus androsaceus JB14]
MYQFAGNDNTLHGLSFEDPTSPMLPSQTLLTRPGPESQMNPNEQDGILKEAFWKSEDFAVPMREIEVRKAAKKAPQTDHRRKWQWKFKQQASRELQKLSILWPNKMFGIKDDIRGVGSIGFFGQVTKQMSIELVVN